LREYLAESGHEAEREAPLFLAVQQSERRKPLTSRQVRQDVSSLRFGSRLTLGVTPHTPARPLLRRPGSKCPIEAVQASVGHNHIATTRCYDKRKRHYRESVSLAVQY